MSCLNLRLPPAKKAWQSFTSKLQNKLHKLNKSKAIKKPKYKYNPPPIKSIAKRDQKRSKQLFNAFHFKRKRTCKIFLKKKSNPVYIDKLFKEPVSDVIVTEFPASVKALKYVDKEVGLPAAAESSSAGKEARKMNGGAAADDMWESLGFASPLMRGIDERAEQFIASFRAEMESELYIEDGSSS